MRERYTARVNSFCPASFSPPICTSTSPSRSPSRAAGEPAVVTCSALKKIYRDKLRRQGVVFVYMQGTFDEVMERLSHRQGHFMKPSMLQSQSDILEEPGDDEIHVNVHIGQADPEHEAMAVAGALGL